MTKKYAPNGAKSFIRQGIISDTPSVCKLESDSYVSERLLVYLNTLKTPCRFTKQELSEALGVSRSTAYRALYLLKDSNLIDYQYLRGFGFLISRVAISKTCPFGFEDCSLCLLKEACENGQGVAYDNL